MPIMRLWNDVTVHRTSAALFVLWWVSVVAFTFFTWSGGMSDLSVSLHVATAIIAGGLVAWWRFPVREGLLVDGWRPAGSPLAGALVAIATVSGVFVREGVIALASNERGLARGAELFASWLVASAILGAIGFLCGLLGAVTSGFIAKGVKSRNGRRAPH
jgi:hypothetical protein